MRKQDAGGQQAQPSEAPAQKQAAETHEEAFDEPDDELEEFDEIGGEVPIDAEVKQWSEDWDAAGEPLAFQLAAPSVRRSSIVQWDKDWSLWFCLCPLFLLVESRERVWCVGPCPLNLIAQVDGDIGWDDEDPDDEFLERLQRELEAFKTNYTNGNPQTRKAA
ncbi:hypothetical protein cyc_05686 [Cyclospora cayetanensis]|uniref:Uncharacterized protein n=1 Tax=Cyclospora cayetanensis TaxID=88456 RepID=A0A1D3DA91_9EIME|nr:hypothetical protein cyc_05686 [Cyclospora cayetanensis]